MGGYERSGGKDEEVERIGRGRLGKERKRVVEEKERMVLDGRAKKGQEDEKTEAAAI